jgi:hypothetical protein
MLELARVFAAGLKPERSIVFAAFTGEEAEKRGSQYFAANEERYPIGECFGMINLDTVGRLGNRKILVLGAGSAEEWIHIFQGAGYVTGFPVALGTDELDSSDHMTFQESGIPAVQIFTGPHLDYHRPTDTVEKIDAEGLLKVAAVAKEAIEYLAGREEPLTVRLKTAKGATITPKKKRNVSLGTIPDYGYRGEGCRLSGVVPGAPAEACGLREGDIIVRIGTESVHDLRDFSRVLRSLKPGARVDITYLRHGRQITVEAVVAQR